MFTTLHDSGRSGTDCLYDWAERTYPTLLKPAGGATQFLAPYTFRAYAQTGAYVGTVAGDGRLYYLGPASGNGLQDLGPMGNWVDVAGCR